MFKNGLKSQGKFLVKMISLSLSMLNEQEKFELVIRKLAEVHNERGVKAVEYGIMGEVLLWSLNHVLGPDIFNLACKKAWIRIYSRMIRIMIPLAVHYEIESGEAQKARILTQDDVEAPVEVVFNSQRLGQSNTVIPISLSSMTSNFAFMEISTPATPTANMSVYIS